MCFGVFEDFAIIYPGLLILYCFWLCFSWRTLESRTVSITVGVLVETKDILIESSDYLEHIWQLWRYINQLWIYSFINCCQIVARCNSFLCKTLLACKQQAVYQHTKLILSFKSGTVGTWFFRTHHVHKLKQCTNLIHTLSCPHPHPYQ